MTIHEYDVVVAGAGAAGLTGALRAAELGLRTLVLEKGTACGGTAARSGGVLWGAATHQVIDAGQPESAELARQYLTSVVGDRTPAALQEAFLETNPVLFDWLADHGVTFRHLTGYPDFQLDHPGALPAGRALQPKPVTQERMAALDHDVVAREALLDGGPTLVQTDDLVWGGRALTARLLAACAAVGVEIWTSCPFRDLVVEDGRVVGVIAERDGQPVEIAAPAGVLLAAGSVDRDPDLRASYCRIDRPDWSLAVPENTGDGLAAAMWLGAATDLMEDAWWAPGLLHPDGSAAFLLFNIAAPTGIMVDRTGRRWISEATPYNNFGHALLAAADEGRPVLPSWFVFDQLALERYGVSGLRPDADQEPWLASGALTRADSPAELADLIGATELAATVERWNGFAERGVDEDFGRGREGSFERRILDVFRFFPGVPPAHEWPNPNLAPVAKGPFYAMRLVLSDLGTKGGLVCDADARVTRPDGSVIDGLYACGNNMATVMGHSYPGPGSPITPGMLFGRRAADDMRRRATP